MAKPKSPHSVKEGSVMEGLFAMYCAAILIDPNDGDSISDVSKFVNSLALHTNLKNLATKESTGPRKGQYKQAVSYNKIFPINKSAPKSSVFGVKVVKGKEAKEMVNNPKLRVAPSLDYFTYPVKNGVQSNYPDFSRVELKVVLKEKEVGTQYGKELRMLLDNEPGPRELNQQKNFESIKIRVESMIKAKASTFFRKLQGVKRKYLNNNKTDVMNWQVDADGIGGEGSGGEVKQDITIRVWANGKRIFADTINFSLKASSATFHSGGLESGIELLIDKFALSLPENQKRNIETMWEDVKDGKAKDTGLVGFVDATYRLVLQEAKVPAITDANSDEWWDLLVSRLFGVRNSYHGFMSLIELNHDSIKKGQPVSGVIEITPDWIKELRDTGMKLYPMIKVDNIEKEGSPGAIFIMPIYQGTKKETNKDKALYKIRINYLSSKIDGVRSGPKAPFKFMTDIGGKGSIIWEYNKATKYFQGKLK
tara:strand:+ start:51 stop:1490 length:1440 start_codon:yes stop_codon:yes gene_type:complete